MVNGNGVLPNGHFRKDWQRRVKCWFNQPAKKVKRRNARTKRAQQMAPRPTQLLRPVVRCQTVKYNSRVRAGRGFTLDELKAAGVNRREARTIGISVDHRRKNRSEESFQANVERLKLYKSKLVVFPRNPTSKRAKQGDSSVEDRNAAVQVTLKSVLPIEQPSNDLEVRKITNEERDFQAYATLRKEWNENKFRGIREKKAAERAEKAAMKAKAQKK
jgi:large subunit ribosomal protein L13e